MNEKNLNKRIKSCKSIINESRKRYDKLSIKSKILLDEIDKNKLAKIKNDTQLVNKIKDLERFGKKYNIKSSQIGFILWSCFNIDYEETKKILEYQKTIKNLEDARRTYQIKIRELNNLMREK